MVCVILPEMSLLVYTYMTTGGRERGSEGGREGGGRGGGSEGGVGETGEKERKEERGIRAKKDGTQTK